jgi:Activator of Hsp90 ATPase homolog 1-like protein
MSQVSGTAIEATLHSRDGKGVARLKSWYGDVEGDLRLGGEFTATVHGSGWDGRGRVEVCEPPHRLVLTMWEEEGDEGIVTVELVADGDHTILEIERSGMPLDSAWAYGAGWQSHLEDLAAHLTGQEHSPWSSESWPRWDELAPSYRELPITPLER